MQSIGLDNDIKLNNQEFKEKKSSQIVVKISYCHKRPCNANTNFRDNRIWKLDHFQSARIVYYHLN